MCSPRTICDMPPPFFDNEESLQVYSRSASSTPCCGLSPNIVVIKLHTTVVIPNYELYYSAPIDAFEPPYHALADGSLVATPFISDVRDANLLLVLLSAAAAFFLINTLSCISFLRRGNIKNKILLYLLLASQVLGVPAMGVLLATYFDQFTNCSTYAPFPPHYSKSLIASMKDQYCRQGLHGHLTQPLGRPHAASRWVGI